MDYKKESAMPVAIKVLPKQYYQSSDSANTSCHKSLKEDCIAVEEPLQISLSFFEPEEQVYQTKILSITMRTPGDDLALIYGFLLCEGIIKNLEDVESCEFDYEQHNGNAVCVVLSKHVTPDWPAIERQFTSHSSCGLCGKTSLNALQLKAPEPSINSERQHEVTIDSKDVYQLPEQLRKHQDLYSQTGSLHAAGLFVDEQPLFIAEDIGRHNAVDKVIGMQCLAANANANANANAKVVLVLSSRISFELVQKAIMANISIIIAAGAPSALAIQAAQQFDLTLIGFTKSNSFNVYHGDWRINNN